MKILIVHLLRIGDLIQSAELIGRIKDQNLGCKLTVLTHWECRKAASLFDDSIEWIYFDRESIVGQILDIESPLLSPVNRLQILIESINSNAFQMVVDLTHTKVSSYICGLIQTEKFFGIRKLPFGSVEWSGPWVKYLESVAEEQGDWVFHYCDIFKGISEVHQKGNSTAISRKLGGHQNQVNGNRIVLQVTSSDIRKNWAPSHWVELADSLISKGFEVTVICSPAERSSVAEIFNVDNKKRSNFTIYDCSFKEAYQIIDQSVVFVTVDTSLKHLAYSSRARIVELALGPSDFYRTGSYKEESVIITSALACSPCKHSGVCSQKELVCHREIEVGDVLSAIDFQLQDINRTNRSLKPFSSARFFLVTKVGGELFIPLPLGTGLSRDWVVQLVGHLSQYAILNRDPTDLFGENGTIGYQLMEWAIRFLDPKEVKFFNSQIKNLCEVFDSSQRVSGLTQTKVMNEDSQLADFSTRRLRQVHESKGLSLLDSKMKIIKTYNSLVGDK